MYDNVWHRAYPLPNRDLLDMDEMLRACATECVRALRFELKEIEMVWCNTALRYNGKNVPP